MGKCKSEDIETAAEKSDRPYYSEHGKAMHMGKGRRQNRSL